MRESARLIAWPIISGRSLPGGASPETVGSKAFHLMRMAEFGLPVPPGFVLGSSLCREYHELGGQLPPGFDEFLKGQVQALERATGLTFGGRRRPMLLAVRSGAAVSMPGMLDTVLDVGMNETTASGLIRSTGNPRLAWDCYRRFAESFGEVVLEIPRRRLNRILDDRLLIEQLEQPRELDAAALRDVARAEVSVLGQSSHGLSLEDPMTQLTMAIEAVLRSWSSPRAISYRRMNQLEHLEGTAITVQTMVFGNAGPTSGAGVGFTRNPSTGEDELYVDFLFNAQGEDVVSGRHRISSSHELRDLLPLVDQELHRVGQVLERELADMQDFEFAVQEGRLFLLQTRPGKRTPWAALRIAVDLVAAAIVPPERGLELLGQLDLGTIERRHLQPAEGQAPIARAIPASLGTASGALALDYEGAARLAAKGASVILVRDETQTDDVEAFAIASGILTGRGGRTSHAAVVARQLGRVCLVGLPSLEIDLPHRTCRIGGIPFVEGDTLTLDGGSGEVFAGPVEVAVERPQKLLAEVQRWRAGVGSEAGADGFDRSLKAVDAPGTDPVARS